MPSSTACEVSEFGGRRRGAEPDLCNVWSCLSTGDKLAGGLISNGGDESIGVDGAPSGDVGSQATASATSTLFGLVKDSLTAAGLA